jgi:hypothetical protein
LRLQLFALLLGSLLTESKSSTSAGVGHNGGRPASVQGWQAESLVQILTDTALSAIISNAEVPRLKSLKFKISKPRI